MTAADRVPAEWAAKVDDLVARGQAARAVELLDQWTRQHAVTPWAMRRLGELRLSAGTRGAAGCAFFWSGERGDPERDECVQQWLRSVRRSPRRIVASLSQRARLPVAQMPGALPTELAALGVTDAVTVRGNREGPAWLQWLAIAGFVGVWFVGLITVIGWLWSLFA